MAEQDHFDLAAILAAILLEAVVANRAAIDATGTRWPDRPIRIELAWHPRQASRVGFS